MSRPFDPDHCTACGDFLPCGESWIAPRAPAEQATPDVTLTEEVLAELDACSFSENVRDGSMCACGLPALNHDALVQRGVQLDYPAITALAARLAAAEAARAALVERVEALAEKWNSTPDYGPTEYDRGRGDQRHDMTTELYEALRATLKGGG